MNEPFRPGDLCLLIDNRGRRYLLDLDESAEFQYHAGTLRHDAIIGMRAGTVLRSTAGARLTALRPRLADYILRMKRGPQVVYPKDLGSILLWGDVGAGMTVLEAGTGSGALTLALVRAVGPTGRVVSVERRAEHAEFARRAIERYFGEIPAMLDLRVGEVETMVAEVAPDRLILDVPEPWHVVGAAADGLSDDGILTAYLPTVPQVQQLWDELRRWKRFVATSTFEVLHREWVAEGRSVRPEHQMIGHTGFITVTQKTAGESDPVDHDFGPAEAGPNP